MGGQKSQEAVTSHHSDHQSELPGTDGCPTRLVPDAPAERDHFGPHQEVARALATLVRTEDGGQSVGLSGKWGAGKSTVIRLFRDDLASAPNYKVWVFDAWAHEGDPLRRTFLESLVTFLTEEEWIDRTRWTDRIDELAGRRHETTQHTSPRLSFMGRLLAVAAVLVPVGIALFADALRGGVTLSRHAGGIKWGLLLGLVLGSAPLWVVIGAAAWKKLVYERAVRRGMKPAPPDYNEVFAVFAQHALTETTTTTLEAGEPTSIEFEQLFGDLMDEALSDAAHRLVLVIDNLDRVDAGDALKIWATLQTFLQHRAHRQRWLQRLWVIMPFDPDAITRLWNADEGRTNDGKPTVNTSLATSFIDKSFQILFDVPTPLVSDWRDYLLSALRTAFPRHTEPEFHTIYRIVAVLLGEGNAPTPREMKIIVNQIGALHRQRHDVPLSHMAYYVMLRRTEHKVIPGLRDGSLPREEDAGLLDESVRDSLAALAFAVEPAKARQFLLEPPITEALAAGSAKDLAGLREVIGFDEVLEDALGRAADDWSAEGGKLFHAVTALVDSGVFGESSNYRSTELERTLFQGVRRMKTLAPLTSTSERGIVLLARRTRDSLLLETIFDRFADAVRGLEVPANGAAAEQFVARIAPVASALADSGLDIEEAGGIPVPGNLAAFVRVCGAVLSRPPAFVDSFRRLLAPGALTDGKLVTEFEQYARQGQFQSVQRYALDSAVAHSQVDWSSAFTAIRDRVGNANGLSPRELEALLGSLIDQRADEASERVLESLVHDGSVGHHINQVTNERDMDALAMCIFTHILVSPKLKSNSQIGNSVAGYTALRKHIANPPEGLPESLAALASTEGEVDRLLDLLDAEPTAEPLVAKALGVLVPRDDLHDVFTPAMVYKRWKSFDGYIDADALLDQARGDRELIEVVQQHGFDHDYATLYTALLRRRPDAAAFRTWCVQHLRGLNRDDWTSELRDNGHLLQLALLCQTQGEPIALTDPFRHALDDLGATLASSEIGLPDIGSWPAVFDLLERAQRDVMLQNIYEQVLQANAGETGEAFFDAFGAELTTANLLSGDRSAFTKVVEPFLEHRNVPGLRWFCEQLRVNPSALDAISQANRTVLRKRIASELADGESDNAHVVVEEIAAMLRIHPPKARSADSEVGTDD